jgi:hypothetical protein
MPGVSLATSGAPQHRHHLAREPCHGIDIGPVIHRADKDDGPFARIGVVERQARIEIIGIDAVVDVVHACGGLRGQTAEKIGFRARDKEHAISEMGNSPLQ